MSTRFCGAVALFMGIVALAGWVFHLPVLIKIRPDWSTMVVTTAVALILGGLVLTIHLPAYKTSLYRLCGFILAALGALVTTEHLLDVNLGIDFPVLHRWMQESSPYPGRMALNTSLGFLLIGIAFMLESPASTRWQLRIRQGVAFGGMLLGLVGLIGYLLHVEQLHHWSGSTGMALHTAIGVAALGFGLLDVAWQQQARDLARQEDGGDILFLVSVSVTVVAVTIAIGAVMFMIDRIERMATDNLQRQHHDRSQYFINAILQSVMHAESIAERPGIAERLRQSKAPAGAAARQFLQHDADGFIAQGFNWIAFRQDGRTVARAGGAVQDEQMTVALQGQQGRELVWADGFYLRVRLPIIETGKIVGEVIAERPLDVLTNLFDTTEEWGETSEMVLCSLESGASLRCFPTRNNPSPFDIPNDAEKYPLPMTYANSGSGTVSGHDYRGRRVLAAYGPIGNSGLGMVLKMDWDELYAPVRQRLVIMLVALIIAVIGTRWLVRRRLRPLVRQLVASRLTAIDNQARFLAAAENNPNGFFILECVRDPLAEILDFRFVYVNYHGARLLSSAPKERFAGQRFCEVLPRLRDHGFFEKYKQVVQTGEALTEEIETSTCGMNAAWINHHVTILGDGVAVTLRDVSTRKAAEEQLKYLAQSDALTGLPNRRLFMDLLKQAISRTRRHRRTMAVLFLDVDRFKQINDTYGHGAGDELLKLFAGLVRASVRDSDTVARLAGDEFTAILEDLQDAESAEIVAQRILASLRAPVQLDEHSVQVSSSIGIALYDGAEDSLTADQLIERADSALYEAKRRGRNDYAIYGAPTEQTNATS